MAMKTYVCPECGRKYEDLVKLQSCISAHIADAKAKEDSERAKREKEIETLQMQNAKLIEQVRENCRKLCGLGVKASVTYFENEVSSRSTKIQGNPISEDEALTQFVKALTDLDKELTAKMTPEQKVDTKEAEKFLKDIFGL